MKKLFFLHVPKCAGMSLLRAVEQAVPRQDLYQSTSMIVNWNENLPDFFGHSSYYRLRALFGHWVHEEMLRIVSGQFVLATSLRDPVARVKSQFRFDVKRSLSSRFELQDGAEFLKRNQNVMCRFLCRAFPSIASDYDTPARGALAVLSGLHFVYDSAESEKFVPLLFERLGWPLVTMPRTNTTEDVHRQMAAPDDAITAAVEQDTLVFNTFRAARLRLPHADNPLFDSSVAERIQSSRKAAPDIPRLAEFLASAYAQEIRHGGDVQRELRNIRWRAAFDQKLNKYLDKGYS